MDHAANDNNFTEGQLNSLGRLVHEFVAAAAREIANEAATAAAQALQSASPTTTRTLAAISDIAPTDQQQPETRLHARLCASHVQDIQSGEFLKLSKLLQKKLATVVDEDNLVPILDNSVVRVSKKSKAVNSITEIEQQTNALTTYMSIFIQKFPRRSQALLQYMILIRYAAQVHKGLGWAIYDYKFRPKASKNHTCVWSDVER